MLYGGSNTSRNSSDLISKIRIITILLSKSLVECTKYPKKNNKMGVAKSKEKPIPQPDFERISSIVPVDESTKISDMPIFYVISNIETAWSHGFRY